MIKHLTLALVATCGLTALPARAVNLVVTNPGFEDITGQLVYNEFTFGVPAGWTLHDPLGIEPDPNVYVGTLRPNGVQFFPVAPPEGLRVALLFNSGRKAQGEYGYVQTLADTLAPNTEYTLNVQVGNITSGTALDGVPYNLSNFPGYRIDLLAGGVPIATDTGAAIAEGAWALRTLTFTTTGSVTPGQALGIRIVSLNSTNGLPDNEVDFDAISLTANPVPEPGTWMTLALGGGALAMVTLKRRRWQL